ncbi:YfbM family protein [Micromonospora sp. ANENR4]|uniref:YfbM family protein n=1 Tax=unclassified Micromonospora TaxID=2617518 RepID=UPI00188EC717|nr:MULTISPECIES: YfbM family protein [unclassified Micromonospora]MBF5032086.1 YfbM family protein [Micromonospora sp. ANENR4]MCZ7477895.1 YfbM family protein [Micromonospora sp. WMMC273]
MNGNWIRVRPDELARARADHDWAYEFAQAAADAEDVRHAGTGKAWQALQFLLERRGVTVPLVTGGELLVALPDAPPEGMDWAEFLEPYDWGYGPPAYLTPEQVAEAATALAGITEEDLLWGVDPAELTAADIYPLIWDRDGELDWVAHHLPYARDYFAAAAKAGDAVICWLD